MSHDQTGGCCGGNGSGGGGGCCKGDNASGACCKERIPAFAQNLTREQIEALPLPDLIARYRSAVENFDPRVFDLSDAELDTAFLPDAGVGQWPIRVLLGHLADAELVNTHRIRRAIGEDRPVFALWDENSFIDANIYGMAAPGRAPTPGGNVAGFVAMVHTLRVWMGDFLRGLSPEAWDRLGMHPERGPISVRRIVASTTWHVEHHARFLHAKLEKLAPVPVGATSSPSEDDAGGCGSGCGCHPRGV
ncbi:MAG: DinB family protein [Planctomycetota bacterium]|nr:DinB family protein [Planctomycetota bacterium]